jgi:DNA-binding response OmpR family regulator
MKVLIAEDDPNTRLGLIEILQSEGYTPVAAENGAEALRLFNQESVDFVCLDIMMPEVNGYDVCREIRRTNSQVPVIFISAKSEEIDKVVGLELGADDFIIKPFGVKEVLARIRAVTRRCLASQPAEAQAEFQLGDLSVLPGELRARRGDVTIDLSLRDLRILELLYQSPGRVLTRSMIFDHAWGEGSIHSSRCLDQHISQLRKRIEIDPKEPRIILTVHGVGYRYEA